MGTVTTSISIVMVTVGIAFIAISVLGMYRLPDAYAKGHVVSKAETVGLILVFCGMFFHPEINRDAAVRLVFILGFALIGNPTAIHAITRAARRAGLKPWTAGTPQPTSPTRPEADE